MKSLKYFISLALIFGLISGHLFADSKVNLLTMDNNLKSSSINNYNHSSKEKDSKKHDLKKMEKERELGKKKDINKEKM